MKAEVSKLASDIILQVQGQNVVKCVKCRGRLGNRFGGFFGTHVFQAVLRQCDDRAAKNAKLHYLMMIIVLSILIITLTSSLSHTITITTTITITI